MTEPIFDDVTEDVYATLPEVYRTEDEPLGFPLKRWLSGIGSIQDEVKDLYERLHFVTPEDGGDPSASSELADPIKADVAWLPWLAQFVGLRLEFHGSSTWRDLLTSNQNGARPGTKEALKEVARHVLTGTKYVEVYDHSISAPGNGGEWDVMILTVTTETLSDPAAHITASGLKPAGILLHAVTFESTFDEIEAGFANWNAIEATDWQGIEEVGL